MQTVHILFSISWKIMWSWARSIYLLFLMFCFCFSFFFLLHFFILCDCSLFTLEIPSIDQSFRKVYYLLAFISAFIVKFMSNLSSYSGLGLMPIWKKNIYSMSETRPAPIRLVTVGTFWPLVQNLMKIILPAHHEYITNHTISICPSWYIPLGTPNPIPQSKIKKLIEINVAVAGFWNRILGNIHRLSQCSFGRNSFFEACFVPETCSQFLCPNLFIIHY